MEYIASFSGIFPTTTLNDKPHQSVIKIHLKYSKEILQQIILISYCCNTGINGSMHNFGIEPLLHL